MIHFLSIIPGLQERCFFNSLNSQNSTGYQRGKKRFAGSFKIKKERTKALRTQK